MLRRFFRATLTAAAARRSLTEKAETVGGSGGGGGGGDTLGKRLFGLVYAKRSAVITIRKWKEEGHSVQKYQLNRIVRELRKLNRYKHALEICEWMSQQPDMKLVQGDYAVHLDLIAKVRGLNSAEKFFEDIPEKMRGPATYSALLHTYVRNQVPDKAEALMEKMSECGFVKNVLPYNHMLSLYISQGKLDKVPTVIQELKKNTSPDVVTYNLWLKFCASRGDLEAAEKVFLELKHNKVEPDWMTFSILTNLYVKMERLEKAKLTLKELEKRASRKNRAAYASLLSLHTNIQDKDGVQRIWDKMKSLFRKLHDEEYLCMVSALVKFDDIKGAEDLYGEWESVSPTGDPRVPNILLAGYINRDRMEDAEKFHHRMVEKGIKPCYTTWELLTWGHLTKKEMDEAIVYFKKAIDSVKSWKLDRKLVKEIFNNLEEHGNVEGAEQLLLLLRKAGRVSTEMYKSLLQTYVKAGKMPLIVQERMEKDNVEIDEETRELITATSKLCVSEIPSCLSSG